MQYEASTENDERFGKVFVFVSLIAETDKEMALLEEHVRSAKTQHRQAGRVPVARSLSFLDSFPHATRRIEAFQKNLGTFAEKTEPVYLVQYHSVSEQDKRVARVDYGIDFARESRQKQ